MYCITSHHMENTESYILSRNSLQGLKLDSIYSIDCGVWISHLIKATSTVDQSLDVLFFQSHSFLSISFLLLFFKHNVYICKC